MPANKRATVNLTENQDKTIKQLMKIKQVNSKSELFKKLAKESAEENNLEWEDDDNQWGGKRK